MKKWLKPLLIISAVLLIIGAGIAWYIYQEFFYPNVPSDLPETYVHIPTNATFDEVVHILNKEGVLIEEASFRLLAEQMAYIKPVMRAGRFKIEPSWSNHELISHLRGGKQSTVKVVLTNERLLEDVAAKVARFIEADSSEIMTLLGDEQYIADLGYTPETLMSLFIPNTYDFYWNTSPMDFMERMQKEHQTFWSKNNRKEKLAEMDMTTAEVYTLASIVERETLQNIEKPRMAGVYLNRLDKGMLLQADPTCVFATRDFETPRVTNYHLEFDSPYNTYLYTGLPPGPISMASIASIDGVLNSETHKYIYFCAKGDGSGLHNFAKTLTQHNRNAAIYRSNLRKRGKR